MKLFIFFAASVLCFSCSSPSKGRNVAEQQDTVVTKKVTLLFVGDFMQHQRQIDAAFTGRGYDYSACFSQVKEEVSKADVAIGNFEVTLGGKPYVGYPSFSAPDEFLSAIMDAGFDVMITANNHCLDKGKPGLERTIQMLDSLKALHAGTYLNSEERDKNYPLLIEKNGFRISLLSYTYSTNGIATIAPNVVNYIDKEVMLRDIENAYKQNPDVVIAYMHWGTEYQSLPDDEQKELVDWLLAHGVDHVIGSHPHVLQPMEVRCDSVTKKKHVVVYSLGNYISNMSVRYRDGGIMFKMELSKDSTVRMDSCGYSLVWTANPEQSGKKNYQLIPAVRPRQELPANAANQLKIFIEDSRELFKSYNKGINEYAF